MAENPEIPTVGDGSALVESPMSPQEREVKGIWEAIQFVDKLARDDKKLINEDVVRSVHKRAMGHFEPSFGGRYRDYDVEIKGAVFIPPHWTDVKPLMRQFGHNLEDDTSRLKQSLGSTEETIAIAARQHYELSRVHPFGDGNGRTSRLLVDLIFKRAGLYYITAWESQKDEYIDVLKRVDQTGNMDSLEAFLASRLRRRYDEIIGLLTKGKVRRLSENTRALADIVERRNALSTIAKTKSSI